MTSHGVLVEAEKQIELVAVVAHILVADAHGKQNVAASNDRLIGVVSIEMKAPPHEDARKNVARRGDALPRGASDGESKIKIA